MHAHSAIPIYSLEPATESQTAEFLKKKLLTIVDNYQQLGLVVTAIVADGAANCQKALAMAAQEGEFIAVRCTAQLLNLLMKDLMLLYDKQVDQAK